VLFVTVFHVPELIIAELIILLDTLFFVDAAVRLIVDE